MKAETHLYVLNRPVQVDLSLRELIRLWEEDIFNPSNTIRSTLERELGPIECVKKHATYLRHERH